MVEDWARVVAGTTQQRVNGVADGALEVGPAEATVGFHVPDRRRVAVDTETANVDIPQLLMQAPDMTGVHCPSQGAPSAHELQIGQGFPLPN